MAEQSGSKGPIRQAWSPAPGVHDPSNAAVAGTRRSTAWTTSKELEWPDGRINGPDPRSSQRP